MPKTSKKKLCAVREIKFEASCSLPGVKHAAGGRCYKTFMGRRGGSALCGPKKASKAQVAWRELFGAAAAHCTGKKSPKARGTCVADRLSFLVGRKSKRTARVAPRAAPRSDRAERAEEKRAVRADFYKKARTAPTRPPRLVLSPKEKRAVRSDFYKKAAAATRTTGVDTSVCDGLKGNPVRYNLCLKNLAAGNVLKPG